MSKQPGGQWSWLVRQVDSELDQAEKSLLLVGGTTGAEVGLPLVNVSHQRLQVRNRALRLNNSSKPRETHDSYQITSINIPYHPMVFDFQLQLSVFLRSAHVQQQTGSVMSAGLAFRKWKIWAKVPGQAENPWFSWVLALGASKVRLNWQENPSQFHVSLIGSH